MTIFLTIYRDNKVDADEPQDEIEIAAEIKMWRGSKGSRDSFGVPLEPDDEPEAEIISVTPDIELTGAEEDAIREKAFEQASDDGREYERD